MSGSCFAKIAFLVEPDLTQRFMQPCCLLTRYLEISFFEYVEDALPGLLLVCFGLIGQYRTICLVAVHNMQTAC